jgi:hypothetical protein
MNVQATVQEKPSALRREHPALQRQNMKYFNFFQFLWVIFVLLDPDSESGSGSTGLDESGTNPGSETLNMTRFYYNRKNVVLIFTSHYKGESHACFLFPVLYSTCPFTPSACLVCSA